MKKDDYARLPSPDPLRNEIWPSTVFNSTQEIEKIMKIDYETKGRNDASRNEFTIPHMYPEDDEERKANMLYEIGFESWLIENGFYDEV